MACMIAVGKKIYLCSPNLDKLCALNGIQTDSVDFHPRIKGYSELSFVVDRYIQADNPTGLAEDYERIIQSYNKGVFGNIDWHRQYRITWNISSKQRFADQLASWGVDGANIDKLAGQYYECRQIPGYIYTVAYTPLLIDSGEEILLSKSQTESYISGLFSRLQNEQGFDLDRLLELDHAGLTQDGVLIHDLIAYAEDTTNTNVEDSLTYAMANLVLYYYSGDIDKALSLINKLTKYKPSPSLTNDMIISNGYEELGPHMYLYLEDIGYFIMEAPQLDNDGNKETKTITAYSIEKEFEYRDWVGIKINCGTVDSMEYSNTDESNKDGTMGNFAIEYVKLIDRNNVNLSFLDQILMKMPSRWNIQYVSDKFEANGKLPAIDIDSQNLYAVMTSEVAPRMNALFVFDYLNFGIRVYHKSEIDETSSNVLDLDTGIFVGFRNLANNISVSVDNDSIYTRFSVEGDSGLNFRDVNYGDNTIINLDYFLGEPYMEKPLVQKMKLWQEFREAHIDEYIELTKRYNAVTEKVYDLRYRVPSDESYWSNWSNINEEGLRKNLEYYENFLQKLQEAVDPRNESAKYDNQGNYLPKMLDGEVDHEFYIDQLYRQIDVISGYYTYVEIYKYILPYINLALSNIGRIESEKEEPEYSISTEWELYGLEELQGVLDSYRDKIATLHKYSKDWSEMTNEEKEEVELNYADDVNGTNYEQLKGRIEYKKYKRQIGDDDTPGTIMYQLKVLNDTIAEYEEELKEISSKTNAYAHLMKFDYSDEKYAEEVEPLEQDLIDERNTFVLNEDELITIMALLKDTDYVNSNYVYLPLIMTTDDMIDRELELLEDAKDKLSEASQPQYTFSVNMDNFFRLPEFEDWAEEFAPDTENFALGMLKFIRVGIRDDYAVKLRVVGYRWNPCEVTPDLTIEFSNMITSRSGRSDLTQLLDTENQRGSKNSIKIGTGTAESAEEYVAALMDVMKNNSVFQRSIQNIINKSTPIGYTDQASVEAIISDYIGSHPPVAGSVDINNVTGLTGDYIVGKIVDAQQGNFDTLSAKIIHAISVSADSADFQTMSANIVQAQEAYIQSLTAGNVTAENITTALLNANMANINTLIAESITTDNLSAIMGTFFNTITKQSFIDYLQAKQITFDEMFGNTIILGDHLTIGSDSDDGSGLIINGRTIQINGIDSDGNLFTAVQIGYDDNDKISFMLSDDGKQGVTIDSGGLSFEIPEGIIVNDMVKKQSLDLDRLSQNVVVANEHGGVSIENIWTDNGQENFGVSYSNFKKETEDFMSQTMNNMRSIEITGSQIFIESDGTITPDSITLTAITKNGAEVKNWYINGEITTQNVSADKKTITIPSSLFTAEKTATIKVDCVDSDITDQVEPPYDVITLYKISDNDSPYTMILNSSEGEIFKQETTTRCTCTIYYGSTETTVSSYYWYITIDGEEQPVMVTEENYYDITVSPDNIKTVIKCGAYLSGQKYSNELTLIMVNDGTDGIQGQDGNNLYTWIKYTKKDSIDDLTSNDLTDDSTEAVFIGISYNNEEQEESWNPEDYNWTRIKPEQNDASFLVTLDNENITFMTDGNNVPVQMQTYYSTVSVYKGVQKIDNFEILTDYIEVPEGLSLEVDNTAKQIRIRATTSEAIEQNYGSIYIPIKVFDYYEFGRTINFTLNRDNTRLAESFVWIRYADNRYPTKDEMFESTSPKMKYVGIAYDQESETPTIYAEDFEWLKMNTEGAEATQVKTLYYKTVFKTIGDITLPGAEALYINTDDGIVNSDQGPIALGWNPWSETKPEYEKGYVYWTCARVAMNDGTYLYTTPILSHEWDYKDKIGGAQLIRNSKTLIDERIYWFV